MKLTAGIMLSDGKFVQPEMIDGNIRVIPCAKTPVETAKALQAEGIDAICINDYDAYQHNYPVNVDVTKMIIDAVDVPVYCSGHIRTLKDIDLYVSMGAKRLVVDLCLDESQKLIEEAFNRFDIDMIVGSIQSKNGMIRYQNAKEIKHFNLLSMISEYEKKGMKYLVVDDYSALVDNAVPDFTNLECIVSHTNMRVVYHGKIQTMEQFKQLQDTGAYSCILTFELFDKHMSFQEIKEFLND